MRLALIFAGLLSGCIYLDDNEGPFGKELYQCTWTSEYKQERRLVCTEDISAALPDLHAECNYECYLFCAPLVIPCTSEDD